MFLLAREAHGDESLCGEGVAFEDLDVEESAIVVAVVVFVEVEVAPTARHAFAGLVRAQVPRRAYEHVHDCFCRFLGGGKRIEIGGMRDVEDLDCGALVCGDNVWGWAALGGWEGGVSGVLNHGAELGEGGLSEKFHGDTYRWTWH